MNDFDHSNKVTGVYWLKTPIDKVKIKIHLKPCAGIKMLPKFETYKDNSANNTMQQLENNKIEEHEFKWQEKVFCLHDIQRYSNIHNCISGTDMAYHDMMQESQYQPNKIFTYINEDCYLPLPLNKIKKTSSPDILNLNSCFERMNLNERLFNEDSSSMGHLLRSDENVAMDEKWTAMHVLYDNSEYNEESQLLIKHETTLLSLYHNVSQNYLIVSPDTNSLDLNPYQLEQEFEYAVNVMFERSSSEQLMVLLQKLSKKWEKKHKQLLKFVMPPLGRKYYFATFEIVSAENFDLDNLYIEFNIKVPAGFQCADALQGRTHVSKCHTHEDRKRWSFGHVIDVHLEAPVNLEPTPLKLFFEVISTDWWERHRTEGYGYLPLSLEPGRYSRQLTCSRPEELDPVAADSRRFFVGGCHLIKDLEILAKPQLQDANFKFTNTGTLSVRWSTITQVPLPGFSAASAPSQGQASALLKGAEAALRQYSRARARLAAATKGLDGV